MSSDVLQKAAMDRATSSTLPAIFEQTASSAPRAIALEFEGRIYTYGELNEHANALAHELIERGIGPEDVVAIVLPRGFEMIIAILGILKCGAIYLPIDTGLPVDRIRRILSDAIPRCLLALPGTPLIYGDVPMHFV